MKKLTLLILALLLCCMWTVAAAETKQPEGDELHAAIQRVTDSPAWVTALPAAEDETTRQLFIVACMGMDLTTASVSMHQRAEDGSWKRFDETQCQRKYTPARLEQMLTEAGLCIVKTVADIDGSPITEESDRHFYICKKIQKN